MNSVGGVLTRLDDQAGLYSTYSRGLQRNPCIRTAQAVPTKADLVEELYRVPRWV